MASAYGIIHNYGEPQSTFDAGLALQALQYKQQKYDANAIKIEQTLNQFGIQMNQLVRPEDREHLYQNVNKLVNSIQGLHGADVGKRGVMQGIIGHISQALDEHTIQQLENSAKIRNFQTQVQTAQESNDGTYSNLNYNYSVQKSGLQSYLNNETDDLSNPLRYIPYVDYKKKLNSIIENRKKIMGEQSVDVRDGKGGISTTTYNNLTDAQWMQVLQQEITPDMKRQMQIDGWAMMGGVSDEVAVEQQEASYLANKNAIQTKIDEKKILLDKADKYNKDILKNDIATLKKQIAVLDDEFTNAPQTTEGIGGTYIMNNTITNLAAIAGSGPSVELSKDDLYFARLKANESKILAGGNTPLPGVRVSDTTTEDLSEIAQKNFLTHLNETEAVYSSRVNESWNSVPQNKRADLQSEVDTYISKGLTEEDAKFKAYETYAKKAKDKDALTNLANIKAAKREYKQATEVVSNGYEEYMGEELWQTNADKLYDSIKEQGLFDDIKVSTLSGETLNSGDYLETVRYTVDGIEKTGVKNADEFKQFLRTEKGRNLKAQVASDVFWGAANAEGSAEIEGTAGFERFNEEDFRNFKTVASILGEGNLKVTDVFNVKSVWTGEPVSEDFLLEHSGDVGGEGLVFELKEGSNTKTEKYLRQRLKYNSTEYIQDRSIVENLLSATGAPSDVIDKTFYNDNTIKNIFTGSDVEKATTESIREEEIAINTPKKITIDAPPTPSKETPVWTELKAVISSGDVISGGGFELDYGTPANIMVNPSNPNQVIISQAKTKDVFDTTSASYTPISSRAQVVVSKNTFNQLAPNLAGQLDLQSAGANVDYLRTLEEEYDNLKYVEGKDAAQVNNYTDVLGVTANLAMEAQTYDLIENRLQEDYRAGYMPYFDTMIERSNNFKLNLNKDGDQVIVNLSAKTTDGEELLYSFDNLSSQETLRLLDIAPQTFLSMYMMYVTDHINTNGGSPTRLIKDLTTTLNNLK